MDRNNETIRLAKKAADAWRHTDTYHQAAQIIDMLISALEGDPTLTPPNEPLTCVGCIQVRCDDSFWFFLRSMPRRRAIISKIRWSTYSRVLLWAWELRACLNSKRWGDQQGGHAEYGL